MTEDGFVDDNLTLLILQDATLWGVSEELKEFNRSDVYATRDRLVNEGYVRITRTGPKHPETRERVAVSRLMPKGGELFQRLKLKLKK